MEIGIEIINSKTFVITLFAFTPIIIRLEECLKFDLLIHLSAILVFVFNDSTHWHSDVLIDMELSLQSLHSRPVVSRDMPSDIV